MPASEPNAGRRLCCELVRGVFEPLKAIDTLNEHAVDYVVVGGWGTLHHGPLV